MIEAMSADPPDKSPTFAATCDFEVTELGNIGRPK